jgi:hypothetical protein
MYVWYLDEDTGIYAGINDDGKLFIGDMYSWDIMEDTVRNRQYIEDCFIKYTGKSLDYGSRWKARIQDKLNNTDGKIKIGIGHMISAMVRYNFGHEEINAMKIAMETGDFSGIYFCKDC